MALSPAGDLYGVEHNPARVIKISASGSISTLAGLHEPTDVATDSAGNLFVIESGRVLMLGNDRTSAVIGETRGRSGIAVDARGVYVADRWPNGSGRIVCLAPTPGAPMKAAGSAAELRARVVAAISANSKGYREIFYTTEASGEFLSADGNTRMKVPRVRYHRESANVNKEPVTVFDGWEDRLPLHYSAEQRTLPDGGSSDFHKLDLLRGLFAGHNKLTLSGSEIEEDARVWIVQAAPADFGAPAPTDPAERCASGLRADVVAARQRLCSPNGSSALDYPGSREQWHFTVVRGNEPCGVQGKGVVVMDEAVSFGRVGMRDFPYAWGQHIAERQFRLDRMFLGGMLRSSFRLFDFQFSPATCAGSAESAKVASAEPVTGIRFDLEGSRFHEPAP